jgi:high-affinity nickel-transport protein
MSKSVGLFSGLIAANAGAWAWALAVFGDRPVLLGTALLAWSLGLRHAVDADHIAAIDNATRKLMQAGGQPVSAGMFFALGHSAVVVLVAVASAMAAPLLGGQLEQWSAIGTLVSVLFLLAIALVNLVILRANWRALRTGCFDGPPTDGGLLVRLCRPLFRLIARPWHMLLLGFLFGLGFDTATEIALLGLSATQAAQGLPTSSILVFPALFAAAMALVDTADSALMVRAYGWALASPIRRLTYNLVITSVSVAVAVIVAGIQLFAFLAERWQPSGTFWGTMARLSEHADGVGLVIIGVFVSIWIGAVVLSRHKRLAESEAAAD